jgi:site-specific DNA recombinase
MQVATSSSLSPLSQNTIKYMVSKVPRAAIYVRVSTDKQEEEGESLETQEARCLERVIAEGHQIDTERHIYREAFTGTVLDRPVLNRIREDAANGEFDVLFFYAYDRLARKQVLQAVLIEFFTAKNVRLVSITENFDESAIGQFMRNTAAFAAEYELEKLIERTSRGRSSILNKGQLLGAGRPTYGYVWRSDRRGYLINVQEAEIVDLIFDWYTVEKLSIYAILQRLRKDYADRNRKGKKGTEQWSKSTVWRILRNAYYIGKGNTHKWQYDDKPGTGKPRQRSYRTEENQTPIAEGIIPRIIDDERFTTAQERLAVNKQLADRNNYNPEMSLLRSGYAICGNCRNKLRAQRKGPEKDHTKERYVYVCPVDTTPTRCRKVSVRCEQVDADAWKYIQKLMKQPEVIEARLAEIEKKLTGRGVDLTPIDNHLAEIERQEQNLAQAIAKASDQAYMMKLVSQEAERLAKDRKEAEKLRAEVIRNVGDVEKVRAKIDNFRSKWLNQQTKLQGEPTYADKREAVQILGLRAIIYSAGHTPRWTFEFMPPEIEFLALLHRAKPLPRPSNAPLPAA